MRKVRFIATGLLVATLLAGCGPKERPYVRVNREQGITNEKILIGNTAATSGAFAGVGVPFNAGLKAKLSTYNEAGGLDGRKVELIHYDDEFDATKGLNLTKKLVDDDKVFALVGHFGTNTVGATVDYIQETGVPMVYAATGINDLYLQKSVGNPLLAVQPIYKTEGRVMVARALVEKEFFGTITKLAVVSTSDDAGRAIMEGVDQQLKEMKFNSKNVERIVLDPAATDYNAQATQLKNSGAHAIIAAMNQAPFTKLLTALKDREVEIPVYTSYVSASIAAIPAGFTTEKRRIFANAWVDLFTEEGQAGVAMFVGEIIAAATAGAITAEEMGVALGAGIAYSLAGYIAADLFIQGLAKLDKEKPLDWFNFVDGMEKAPFKLPMASEIDYREGKRWGLESLLLLERVEKEAETDPDFVLRAQGELISEIVARR